MERGRICVERNGSERSEVASVANRKPPASPGHREGKRLRASARYETVFTRRSTKLRGLSEKKGSRQLQPVVRFPDMISFLIHISTMSNS